MSFTLGLIGARGHTGAELLRLLASHPRLEVAHAVSRELAGQPIRDHVPSFGGAQRFEDFGPDALASKRADAWILALPNDKAAPWVSALDAHQPHAPIIDLSADHRFTDAWAYGLPELHRPKLLGARRIANPGCYATGMQLAIAPLLDLLGGPPVVFGVSGYSGAGSTPNERNNPEVLRDNLLPYSLVDHTHEREVSRHLGREVFFSPHVAPFFRGIALTISLPLAAPSTPATLWARYEDRYRGEPMLVLSAEAPRVRDSAHQPTVQLGGLAVDPHGRRAVVVATLDNLLKGAATQALQNVHLALGLPEFEGLS
jgi:N-acetyl-gamma-glutamyl-phosphate reductase